MRNDTWQPSWWKEQHFSAWNRVKEALHRDWEQTMRQFGSRRGHELNQGVADTVKQIAGTEPLPPSDAANPPKVIGDWADVESPVRFGYGAREQYGTKYPTWEPELESRLQADWESATTKAHEKWADVRLLVWRGYNARLNH